MISTNPCHYSTYKLYSRLLYNASSLFLLLYRPSRLVLCISRLIQLISRLIRTNLVCFFCFKPSSSPTRLDLFGPSSPLKNKTKSQHIIPHHEGKSNSLMKASPYMTATKRIGIACTTYQCNLARVRQKG